MPKKVSVANFTVKLDFMNFLSFFLFITAESLMYLRIRMGQPIGEKIKRDEMINTYGEGIILPDYWFVVTESRANSIYEFFHNISKDFRRYGVLDVEAIERWVAGQFVHDIFVQWLNLSLYSSGVASNSCVKVVTPSKLKLVEQPTVPLSQRCWKSRTCPFQALTLGKLTILDPWGRGFESGWGQKFFFFKRQTRNNTT